MQITRDVAMFRLLEAQTPPPFEAWLPFLENAPDIKKGYITFNQTQRKEISRGNSKVTQGSGDTVIVTHTSIIQATYQLAAYRYINYNAEDGLDAGAAADKIKNYLKSDLAKTQFYSYNLDLGPIWSDTEITNTYDENQNLWLQYAHFPFVVYSMENFEYNDIALKQITIKDVLHYGNIK